MDTFTQAYIEAALWSSNDDDDKPLDHNYDLRDIAPETMEKIRADCARFQSENSELLEQATYGKREWSDAEMSGHDFWLTRNRHGAGFWDGDLPDRIGDALTTAAHAFGECSLYVGDDGLIYC